MITETLEKKYTALLDKRSTEKAVKEVKATFSSALSASLELEQIAAPSLVLQGTGINDDLNGIERPVTVEIKGITDRKAEVVHSLAKWKRLRLAEYGIDKGKGIYTDMRALRQDEDLSPIHSVSVDQWDWEKHISVTDRKLDYLKETVQKIYRAILLTETSIAEKYPEIKPILPPNITFVHTEDLEATYPNLTPKQRETEVTKTYGAVFLIGIGADLASGEPHDGRAPDYDDWSTITSETHKGLNGDILVWNPVLESAFEISSMGIRVDQSALERQLAIRGAEERKELLFHKKLLAGELTESIGGGIGQSRLSMFLLRKAHIGEVQVSIWPDSILEEAKAKGIELL